MKKQEILDEFKKHVIYTIQQDETTIEQVVQYIKERMTELSNLFESNGVNFLTISDYMEEELKFLIMKVTAICQDRTDMTTEQISFIVEKIQRKIDEEQSIQGSDENQEKSEFDTIETEDASFSRMITSKLEEFIMDIKTKAAAIMDSYGVDYSKIEEVISDTNSYMNKTLLDSEEELYDILSDNKKRIIEMLNSEYEQALESFNKNQEKEFRDNLDAGISLDEQHEFVENIYSNNKDNEQKSEKHKKLNSDNEYEL